MNASAPRTAFAKATIARVGVPIRYLTTSAPFTTARLQGGPKAHANAGLFDWGDNKKAEEEEFDQQDDDDLRALEEEAVLE